MGMEIEGIDLKKIATILGLIMFSIMLSGCLETGVLSNLDQSLVGTWESSVVNGYYIHQKIFGADGSFTSRWQYATSRSTYSEASGTWTADGYTLTTVTDHTDTYSYTFIDSNTFTLRWDGESRIYYKK